MYENMEPLCRKGFIHMNGADNIEKLNHVGLQGKESFYSTLKQETISDDDYEYATNVYITLNWQTFKDYQLIYIHCDVLLLVDVFENFRKTCLTYYKLDPASDYTSPSLAWDACLKMTNIKLNLMTDIDMLNMMEKMKRGGLCFVESQRYVKANNKYLPDYNPSVESNYILYEDANNLYAYSMSENLPYKNLKFEENIHLHEILKTPDNYYNGYIVEVDLHFSNRTT